MANRIPAARGALSAGAATLAAGSSAAVSPLISHFPLLAGQFWRYLVAALVLLALCRRGRDQRASSRSWGVLTVRQWGRILLLAATGMAGFNLCLLHAVRGADPAAVGTVVGASPVLLALLGPVLDPLTDRRRPHSRLLGAAVLVSVGLAVARSAGSATPTGLLWAAGALGCECCFSLLAVELLALLGPLRLSALACLATALLTGAGALAVEGRAALRLPGGAELPALAYLALVVTSLAFVLWYSAVELLGVERTGLFVGLLPLGALLAGPLLGTAELTAPGVLGALLVAAAVVWGVTAPRAERAVAGDRSGARAGARSGDLPGDRTRPQGRRRHPAGL
ncbi:hypothetical protein GCM10009665_44380 [Kitasatospora nipponensis]|uniref:EamA domain-containing protein n=1 Tax=Kitasatospora nipponensis TaxID=258049 RepID=A0ABN1WHT8_9ACTN